MGNVGRLHQGVCVLTWAEGQRVNVGRLDDLGTRIGIGSLLSINH